MWKQCLELLHHAQEGQCDQLMFVTQLAAIVRSNEQSLLQVVDLYRVRQFSFAQHEADLVRFMARLEPERYALQSLSVQSMYEFRLKYPPKKEDEVWQTVAAILEDCLTFESNERCPSCSGGMLELLADRSETYMYHSCRKCSFTRSQDGIRTSRNGLFPAPHHVLVQHGYLEQNLI